MSKFTQEELAESFHKLVKWITNEQRKIQDMELAIKLRVLALEQLARGLSGEILENDEALVVAMTVATEIIDITGRATIPKVIGNSISLTTVESLHICAILEMATSFTEAAAILGIDQATLYRKRKELGLNNDTR